MRKPMTIRLTPEVRAALKRLANRQDRSMASVIQHLIAEAARKEGAL